MADMIKKVLSVSFLVILASCRSAPVAQTGEAVIEQETAVINPEPVKGRVDVYESMARSVKYNTGATLRELRKKVVYDKNTNPRSIVNNILKMKNLNQNPLYDSLRALDFAIIYAAVNLSDDEHFTSAYLNAKRLWLRLRRTRTLCLHSERLRKSSAWLSGSSARSIR